MIITQLDLAMHDSIAGKYFFLGSPQELPKDAFEDL